MSFLRPSSSESSVGFVLPPAQVDLHPNFVTFCRSYFFFFIAILRLHDQLLTSRLPLLGKRIGMPSKIYNGRFTTVLFLKSDDQERSRLSRSFLIYSY